MDKKAIATAIASVAVVGGIIALGTHHAPTDPHPDRVLKNSIHDIPAGTTLEWNNGKYIPKSMPGYETPADYPDAWWLYDEEEVKANSV